MNNSKVLGNKIRQYRIRAGMSQMDLELEIDASPGSLSRIESGKVNPNKETLAKIGKVLLLSPLEIADLFDIKIKEYTRVFANAAAAVTNTLDFQTICQNAVDKLLEDLNLLSGFIVIKKGNYLYSIASSNTQVSFDSLSLIKAPFNSLSVSLIEDVDNLIVKTVINQKSYSGSHLRDFIVPAVSLKIAIILEKITNTKSLISIPLIINNECLGAIIFGKDRKDDSWQERELLESFAKQVAIAIMNSFKFELLVKK